MLLALLGAFVAGRTMGRMPRMPLLHMLLFAGVISITVYFIIDMEFPRVGIIRVGAAEQALYDLRQALQ